MIALVSGGAPPVGESCAAPRAAAFPPTRDENGSAAKMASFRDTGRTLASAGILRKHGKQKVGKWKLGPKELFFCTSDAQSVRSSPQFRHL